MRQIVEEGSEFKVRGHHCPFSLRRCPPRVHCIAIAQLVSENQMDFLLEHASTHSGSRTLTIRKSLRMYIEVVAMKLTAGEIATPLMLGTGASPASEGELAVTS